MNSTTATIYDALANLVLVDPHTHINPHAAASDTLADLLGYHYYTELAHSAGMPKGQIEDDEIGPGKNPRELVRRLIENLDPINNTAQYRWLVEICRRFFDFEGDRIDSSNWEAIYDNAESKMASAQWADTVLEKSGVEAVFLTNDFDDDLDGFDTNTYIPCLRTDDLVFHLGKDEVRQRLAGCTGIELDGSLSSLRASLEQRFEHFTASGARACAISLPPSFSPSPVSDGRASIAMDQLLRHGSSADPSHFDAISRRVFWTITELCDQYGLPFDLMIGVNRGVYAGGVYQGQDLYDSRVSLIQYKELFNTFPDVKFPISVLASVTNQELVSYAWIFPNVITNGHWWYSNTPSFIARDAMARLEAVPRTKQIGYYSDAYKLEFVWPKFDMYKRILAGILADHFVIGCGWSEENAIDLGKQVLRGNVDTIFPELGSSTSATMIDDCDQTVEIDAPDEAAVGGVSAVVGATAAASLAAGAIEIQSDDVEDAFDSSAQTVMMDPGEAPIPLPEEISILEEAPISEESLLADLDPTPSQEELGNSEFGDGILAMDADSIEREIDGAPIPFEDDDEAVEIMDNDGVDFLDDGVDIAADAGLDTVRMDDFPIEAAGSDDDIVAVDETVEDATEAILDDASIFDDDDDDSSPEIEMLQGENVLSTRFGRSKTQNPIP